MVCITTEESFFILRYSSEIVERARENKTEITEDGIEDAFEVTTVVFCFTDYFVTNKFFKDNK